MRHFSGHKNGDYIPLGFTATKAGKAFPYSRYNNDESIRCIYSVSDITVGATTFRLIAWDTKTQQQSTSTTLAGSVIIIFDS